MPTKGIPAPQGAQSPPWCLSPNPQNASSAPAGVTASQRGERLLFQGNDCQREKRYIAFFFLPCLRQRRQFLSICPKKGRKLNLFLQRCQHTASIGSQGVCDRGSVVGRGERWGGGGDEVWGGGHREQTRPSYRGKQRSGDAGIKCQTKRKTSMPKSGGPGPQQLEWGSSRRGWGPGDTD